VQSKEAECLKITTDALVQDDLYRMNALSAFWDTLGWVYFKQGHFDKAEPYLAAAWNLSQVALNGEHLATVYEKQGRKAESGRVLALSKAAAEVESPTPNPQLRRRDGSFALSHTGVSNAVGELSQMRRFKLGKLYAKPGSAEFWLLFANGSRLEQTKFISGDQDFRQLGGALRSVRFNILFPDEHPTRILRRGVLVCEGMNLGCDFTVYAPGTVSYIE